MSGTAGWTTPADIKAQLRRHWDRGRMLAARVRGESLFPLPLRLKRPDSRALVDRFDEVRRWIQGLAKNSKAEKGFGYDIGWAEIDHRQLGRNRVPQAIIVATEADALRLIGKEPEAERFQRLVSETLEAFPLLRDWLARRPLTVLERGDDWERVLAVLAWFRAHPRPGLYLRQLDIPGVDTKFIETHKGLLSELLDRILPATAVDREAKGVKGFEPRYGLLAKPPLVRFRLLDERFYQDGLSDLTVPVAQFARWHSPVRRVFITENEINGLAFPDVPESLVIFGLGYGLDRLTKVGWLGGKTLYYWGDIDTHGFAMLDRLRAAFPQARSLLMDKGTLLAHRELWVREAERHDGPLERLSVAERALFDDLRQDRLGERVRLEQERIGFRWLERALRGLLGTNPHHAAYRVEPKANGGH
jgi:hypothetical protein